MQTIRPVLSNLSLRFSLKVMTRKNSSVIILSNQSKLPSPSCPLFNFFSVQCSDVQISKSLLNLNCPILLSLSYSAFSVIRKHVWSFVSTQKPFFRFNLLPNSSYLSTEYMIVSCAIHRVVQETKKQIPAIHAIRLTYLSTSIKFLFLNIDSKSIKNIFPSPLIVRIMGLFM